MLLHQALVPESLIESAQSPDRDGLVLVDIEILDGKISKIQPVNISPGNNCKSKIVLPCFVDMHTHLDKAHTWERSPNPDRTFDGALKALGTDRIHWNKKDISNRINFALQCSYSHGTQAIRTHLDVPPSQIDRTLAVFEEMQTEWHDRVELQAVSLISIDLFDGKFGEKVADTFANMGGVLGGVAYPNAELDQQLDRVFTLAKARQLPLDFHVDETNDPDSHCLRSVAEAVLRHQFPYPVTCGHCCSLAVQDPEVAKQTIDRVKASGIGIVSLPLCNLFLQDRQKGRTPRWRGITLLQELQEAEIPVAIAHDNCRDAFYGFGDHDLLQIFAMSLLIGHLDTNYNQWIKSITIIPAQLMGLDLGKIKVGMSADLIMFNARCYSELFSRPQTDRVIIRKGKEIQASLPSYEELDHNPLL